MAVKDTQVGLLHPGGHAGERPAVDQPPRRGTSNPTVFDPGRFDADRAEDKGHRFAWMPFGGGVHKCIGLYFGQMEIKTIMHNLLRDYEWTVPSDYVVPMDYSALPVPKDKLPVNLRRLT